MTATWRTPRTWVAGEVLTATLMNEYIRDALDFIHDKPLGENTLNLGANLTTTGTSFADMDSTNLSETITSSGKNVLFCLRGVGGGTSRLMFDYAINDVRQIGDDGGIHAVPATDTPVTFTVIIDGSAFTAGQNYKFEPMWKVDSGTGTWYAGAGTSNKDFHPQFFVTEL